MFNIVFQCRRALFSTAGDVAKFGQMFLNKGTFQGRRYLSEATVAEMTTKQTAPEIKTAYGFGWTIRDSGFEHFGHYKTDLSINTKLGLVTVFMIQLNGDWPTSDGNNALRTFQHAAEALMPGAR